MTNLDRLKGTPYLLDGFGSFLDEWFERVPRQEFPELTAEAKAAFKACPPEVLRFHTVFQNHPMLWRSPPAWQVLFPPSEVDASYPKPEPRLKIQRLKLIAEQYQGVVGVMISLDEHNYGRLWISDQDATRVDPLRGLSVDEFLVLITLTMVMDCSPTADVDVERYDEASTFYSGTLIDAPMSFRYHPGVGKLWLGSETIPFLCVERP